MNDIFDAEKAISRLGEYIPLTETEWPTFVQINEKNLMEFYKHFVKVDGVWQRIERPEKKED